VARCRIAEFASELVTSRLGMSMSYMGKGPARGATLRRFRRDEMHEQLGSASTPTSSFMRLLRYPTRRRCGRVISSPAQSEQDGPSYCCKHLRSSPTWRSARREYLSRTSEARLMPGVLCSRYRRLTTAILRRRQSAPIAVLGHDAVGFRPTCRGTVPAH
jgi:hypothetical protein